MTGEEDDGIVFVDIVTPGDLRFFRMEMGEEKESPYIC